ncbi:MAG: hypothetical protein JO327_12175 [Nitrososphaeraceae archaeon]|nr:hypothetical protein [Nitrososphaeraceae archaeon]MBV9668871.1 hypothetical protein [Nitrososphaeraceae archaeon]
MGTNTDFNNNNNSNPEITRVPKINYHEIINQLSPAVIPRVSAIANMGWCERAAYDISFFGVDAELELQNLGLKDPVCKWMLKDYY